MSQIALLTIAGCSQLPPQVIQSKPQPMIVTETTKEPQETIKQNGITITPYQVEEIKKETLPPPQPTTSVSTPNVTTVVVPTKQPPARQTPLPRNTITHQNHNLPPAAQNLITQAQQAFKQQRLDQAEHLAIQAQRISPSSSESYALLAHIALAKNNTAQAQALAQRAASLSGDVTVKKQLWSIVLQTAQQQNNTNLINKAQNILSALQAP